MVLKCWHRNLVFAVAKSNKIFLRWNFHNHMQEDDSDIKQVPLLKDYVRKMIVSPIDDNFLSKLNFINSVQRLGVSYHFEHEIDEALHQIYEISTKENNIIGYDNDLHHLALLFRLLRQQGYPILSGMKFLLLYQI